MLKFCEIVPSTQFTGKFNIATVYPFRDTFRARFYCEDPQSIKIFKHSSKINEDVGFTVQMGLNNTRILRRYIRQNCSMGRETKNMTKNIEVISKMY